MSLTSSKFEAYQIVQEIIFGRCFYVKCIVLANPSKQIKSTRLHFLPTHSIAIFFSILSLQWFSVCFSFLWEPLSKSIKKTNITFKVYVKVRYLWQKLYLKYTHPYLIVAVCVSRFCCTFISRLWLSRRVMLNCSTSFVYLMLSTQSIYSFTVICCFTSRSL